MLVGNIRTNSTRVAVIGAGASGLTTAKALLEVGAEPVVYEAAGRIGGLWAYDHREPSLGPSYRSLCTNTSKQITAFSDFPFAHDVDDFPFREVVERYLGAYASAFNLLPHIRFGCSVRDVSPTGKGEWSVTVGVGDRDSMEPFDAVCVCSGVFRRRFVPEIPGLQSFSGQVIHSMDYGSPERFEGRSVVVVGIGSSAVDIATDLASIARKVTLSVRRGVWVAPRMVEGRPLDHRATRLFMLLPEKRRTARRKRLLLEEYERRGLSPPGTLWLRSGVPFHPESAPSVTSDVLLSLLSEGTIHAKSAIERVDGAEICFADGSMLRPDAIIFCTGYAMSFPFLPWMPTPWTDSRSGLYRLVFPPDQSGLAFVGVCRAHGPILPIVEMQARWAARVLVGEAALPPHDMMRAEIDRRWETQRARNDSPIRVPLMPYLDEIGGQIGVRPKLWRHPQLLQALLNGPPLAAQFRLDGPDSWPGATDLIRSFGR